MKNVFLSLILCLFCSCEGYKSITGQVISASTDKPVFDAEINVLKKMGNSTRTYTNGQFELHSGLTGMMFGGPKFKFEVKKDGYVSKIIKTKFNPDTIRLVNK